MMLFRFVLLAMLPLIHSYSLTDDCALIKADNAFTWEHMISSYVQLPGLHNAVNNYFELDYDVIVGSGGGVGPMFSMGAPENFSYLPGELDTPSYIVTSLTHGSAQLLVKNSTAKFPEEIIVARTWPDPFNIFDGEWHHVRVFQNSYERTWRLEIDHGNPFPAAHPMTPTSTINLGHCGAYLGGRPDYTAFQFQGLFKNVVLNGNAINLREAKTNGYAKVADCESRTTRRFREQLLASAGRPYRLRRH